MFIEAIGIVLLVVLIVITWRIVDAIMQAPGTSAALPLVSVPPVASSVLGYSMPNVDTSALSAYYQPSVLTSTAPNVTRADVMAPIPTTSSGDMSAYFPTSLAGTPTPTVPTPTVVDSAPTVSSPAPVVATPTVVSTPAPVSKLLAYFNRMPPDAKLIGKPKNVPPTCPTGYEYGASMHCQSSTGTPPLFVIGTCPSGSQTVDTSTMPGQFKLPPQICIICPPGSTGLADGPDGGCISGGSVSLPVVASSPHVTTPILVSTAPKTA